MDFAPILETPRLALRAHRLDDLDACVAMWAEPEVVRYTVGTPSSPQRTWLRMLGYRGHWSMLGFGYWAVIERATGTFVGELGFADFKREVPDDLRGLPELGWAFARSAWGKGYATEGVRAAIAWGDAHFAGSRTVCLVNPENVASANVARKCGFREHGRITLDGDVDEVFVRDAEPG
jgi:RimJ/RimL family protein N-acetyltransferase